MAVELRAEENLRRVLALGLGGGLLPAALGNSGVQVLAVEHSSSVRDLAKRFFGVECAGLEIVTEDALAFVEGGGGCGKGLFDGCVVDIFEGCTSSTPAFTRSPAFLRSLKELLMPGAPVLQNVIDSAGDFLQTERRHRRFGALGNGKTVRCTCWARNAAPLGPLRPVTYRRQTEELTELLRAYREVFEEVEVLRKLHEGQRPIGGRKVFISDDEGLLQKDVPDVDSKLRECATGFGTWMG
ncbi:unnamed protein product [Symbiodinium sp. CCMP2592]|nr:unnamed protein product [Symbiodinium sp. CCMP2592]